TLVTLALVIGEVALMVAKLALVALSLMVGELPPVASLVVGEVRRLAQVAAGPLVGDARGLADVSAGRLDACGLADVHPGRGPGGRKWFIRAGAAIRMGGARKPPPRKPPP